MFTLLNENEISIETYCNFFYCKYPHLLLDIRESWEREKVRIEPSSHIILSQLSLEKEKISGIDWIIVYCHHGIRSLYACHLLKSFGFDKVVSLKGGIHRWAKIVDDQMVLY